MRNNLISAINIHTGGGLTYLYLLHSFLDNKSNVILFDERVKAKIPNFSKAKLIFFKKGPLRNIKIFCFRFKKYFKLNNKDLYEKNKYTLSEIYLNGIPPLFRFFQSKVRVYIFLQNKLIFDKSMIKRLSVNNILVMLNIFISKFLLYSFKKNNDILIAQTNSMFKILTSEFKKNKIISQEKIWGNIEEINLQLIKNLVNEKKSSILSKINQLSLENFLFFYPARLYAHKNHKKLFEAIELLENKSIKRFKLILTIKESDLQFFSIKNKSNILCIGEIDYFELLNIYKLVDYLLFPSLSESFGLPLLEAKLNKTKIMASDLDYVFDICKPEFVFNPFEVKDIYNKIYFVLKNSKYS